MARSTLAFNYHLEMEFNNSSMVFKTMYMHFLLKRKKKIN